MNPNLQSRQERSAELNKRLNPNDYVQRIVMSEPYRQVMSELRNDPDTDPHVLKVQRGEAISQAAEFMSRESETSSGHKTFDGHILEVISHLPQFLDSQIALNTLRKSYTPHSEKAPHLDNVVRLNHALKELVDANPLLSFTNVLGFLQQMNTAINGQGHAELFSYEARSILVGMRHEIAVEQMLGMMPDVDYQDTSLENDLKGSDVFVSIDNSPYVAIDIKASEMSAQNAQQKAARRGYNPAVIVWSQLYDNDFGDNFRIPHETALERKDNLHEQLVRAVVSETSQRARA